MPREHSANTVNSPAFRQLRRRLMLSYFGVIAAILTIFLVFIDQTIAYKFNRQLREHVMGLASSSAQSLEIITHEYAELVSGEDGEENELDDEYEREYGSRPKHSSLASLLQTSGDGEVQLSVRLEDLMQGYEPDTSQEVTFTARFHGISQTVEWFNEQRKLLVREGELRSEMLFPTEIPIEGMLLANAKQLSFLLPVYLTDEQGSSQLLGYVRTTASTQSVIREQREIRVILGIGFLLALTLTIICGNGLTAQALDPLANNVSQLQQFTSDAAHELRTPLTVIKGAVHMLIKESEQLEHGSLQKLDFVADASQQINQLVDDLLLLARLDAAEANVSPNWSKIPIDEILEDLFDEFQPSAEAKNVQLSCTALPSVKIMGDAQQLKSLFGNLISNALRYTPAQGKVWISLERKGSYALITVKDTGIGIAEEQLSKVFDRFWRADQARSYVESGSGLGLAISQTIAHRHGGRIWVESRLGKGSTFIAKFPNPV